MAAADYRLMTEATGQRIAAGVEALSGTGAAAAAARTNLDVYSKDETDAAIAQSTATLQDEVDTLNSKIAVRGSVYAGHDLVIDVSFAHGSVLVSGIFQTIGAKTILIQLYNGNILNIIDLTNLNTFSNGNFTFSSSNSTITISSTLQSVSNLYVTKLC